MQSDTHLSANAFHRQRICLLLLVLIPLIVSLSVQSSDSFKLVFGSERAHHLDIGSIVFIMDADGSNVYPLHLNDYLNVSPTCSPDGTKFGFLSDALYIVSADFQPIYTISYDVLGGIDRYSSFSITEDADRIVYVTTVENNYEVFAIDTDGSNRQQITAHSAIDNYPAISPDGSQIVFASNRDVSHNERELYIVNADGTGLKRLTFDGGFNVHPSWSPDGTTIVFSRRRAGEFGANITTINSHGTDLVQLTDLDNKAHYFPAFSPDGTQIAFASNRNAAIDREMSIYVMDISDGEVVRVTSGYYEANPCWITVNTTDQP
jgi:TolB protein